MAKLLQLETFEIHDAPNHASSIQQAEVEELRLNAYEQGYAAGWDDAVTAQNDEVARLRSDLGRNLVEMSLSHRDARRHILGTLEPLLHDMVTKVLPSIAHQTLGQMILDLLRPSAENLADAPVLVKTAPENVDMVERLLTKQTGMPLRVIAEPTLGQGQAYLKLGESEIRLDLDGVIDAIAEAVSVFFHTENDEVET